MHGSMNIKYPFFALGTAAVLVHITVYSS